MIYGAEAGWLHKINNRKCKSSRLTCPKYTFSGSSDPWKTWVAVAGLPLVSDVNVIAGSWYDRSFTTSVVWVKQPDQSVIAETAPCFSSENNFTLLLFLVFLSHSGVGCCREGKNEGKDEAFQIRLFLSTSLFQKSETTQNIMVSGCFELLQLLNGSSLSSPQNCFIVVLKLCSSLWVGCWATGSINLFVRTCRLLMKF